MAELAIPFGGKPYRFHVPDKNLAEVLSPGSFPSVENLEAEIERALDRPILQDPLEAMVKPTDRVLLVGDDNTRSTPVDRMIPALLRRLNRAGLQDDQISCLIALGTHRYMTEEEIVTKVGPAVFNRIRVLNHEWRNPDVLVDLGTSSRGTPLQVNRLAAESDVVIGLGAIVPHHIPGFSGSSKIIQPGVCEQKTRLRPTCSPVKAAATPSWDTKTIRFAGTWATWPTRWG